MSCSRTQHSDAGEARTRGPSVSSQALYHWATALPPILLLQCEGQALPNARQGVYSIQSIKTCSRSRSYNIFWCSTQLSMEFMLFINVKKCWHLNSIFKIGEFFHVNEKNIFVQVNILVFTGSWTYNVAARFFRISKVNVQICAQFYTEMCPWWPIFVLAKYWCRKISHQSTATSI